MAKQLTRCYVGVLKRLVSRIRRIRPEYREEGSWQLFHDNAPSHRSTLTTDYLLNMIFITFNEYLQLGFAVLQEKSKIIYEKKINSNFFDHF